MLRNVLNWSIVLGEAYISLVLFPIIAAVLGLTGARLLKLEKQETSTIMIEAGVQNTALALGIILASIPDNAAQVEAIGLPLAYAAIGNIIAISYSVVLFKIGWTYGNPSENPILAFIRAYCGCCHRGAEDESNKEDED